MPHEQLTWNGHQTAMDFARLRAQQTGVRQAVKREDGTDRAGPYRFRIMHTAPAPETEVAEPPC